MNTPNITDWISAIGAIASVLTAIFVFRYSKKQDKKNNELFAIERKAKLYSQIEIVNKKNIKMDLYKYDNLFAIDLLKKFNILKSNKFVDNNRRCLQIEIFITNITKIVATDLLIKDLNIKFLLHSETKKEIKLLNYECKFKKILLCNNNTSIIINCILSDEDIEFFNNMNLYDNIFIEINTLFKNSFKIITECTYCLILKYNSNNNFNIYFDRYLYDIKDNILNIHKIYEEVNSETE